MQLFDDRLSLQLKRDWLMNINRKWIMIPAPLPLCVFLSVAGASPMVAIGQDSYLAEDGIIKDLPSTACIGDTIVINGNASEQTLYTVEMVYWGADEEKIGGGPQQEAHLGTFEATGDWTFLLSESLRL